MRRAWAVRAVIVILVLGAVAWLLLGSEFFAIEEIAIRGGERTQRQLEGLRELIRIAGVRVGGNIFRTDLERAQEALLHLPWVRAVELHRRLPDRIEVRLVERIPFLIAELDSGRFWVDCFGYLIELAKPEAEALVLRGARQVETPEGPRLDDEGVAVVRAVAEVAAYDPGFVLRFRDLQITPQAVILRTTGGLRVIMESTGLAEELERLRRLLAVINEGHYLYIDLRFGDVVMMPR